MSSDAENIDILIVKSSEKSTFDGIVCIVSHCSFGLTIEKQNTDLIEFLHTYTGSLCNTQKGPRAGRGLKHFYLGWVILIPNLGQVLSLVLWPDSIILNLTESDGF